MMALLWILLGLSVCDSFAELCSGNGVPSQGDHCFSGSLEGVHLRMASQATGILNIKFVQDKNEAECRGNEFQREGRRARWQHEPVSTAEQVRGKVLLGPGQAHGEFHKKQTGVLDW